MIKYGKTYRDISVLKADFVNENSEHLKENNRIASIYKEQPKRKFCKICRQNISHKKMFKSHGLEYFICENCGHVNGQYMETADLTTKFYEKWDYGKNYRVDEKIKYDDRLQRVYVPKVEFLIDSLKESGVDPSGFMFLDVGAGSGYFAGALRKKNLKSHGIEVSKEQVEYGNKMLGEKLLLHISQNGGVTKEILSSNAEVISFIGVLEHIVNLDEILDAVSKNDHIKFIYFSVPMFSYSVFFESVSDDIFNRLLGGTHTHIFTDSSLEYLYKKFKWEKISEWRFGTDAADLLRIITVKMLNSGNLYLADLFNEKYSLILDEIQLLMDRGHFCSETHVLVRKTS